MQEYGLNVFVKQRKGKHKGNVGTAVWNTGIRTQEIRFRQVPQVEEEKAALPCRQVHLLPTQLLTCGPKKLGPVVSVSQKLSAIWSTRSHPLPPFVLICFSLSPSHLFSRSQLNIRPISQATCLEQSKGSKSISAAQQWCRRASERQLVVHAQGRSLENQQWWNMFFFNDSKLMIFSSIHHAWFPWAYAKEKKTRDSSGCFNSSEMASPLQDSTGKE